MRESTDRLSELRLALEHRMSEPKLRQVLRQEQVQQQVLELRQQEQVQRLAQRLQQQAFLLELQEQRLPFWPAPSLQQLSLLGLHHQLVQRQLSWPLPFWLRPSLQAFLLLAEHHASDLRARPYGEHGRLERLPLKRRRYERQCPSSLTDRGLPCLSDRAL